MTKFTNDLRLALSIVRDSPNDQYRFELSLMDEDEKISYLQDLSAPQTRALANKLNQIAAEIDHRNRDLKSDSVRN